MRLSVNKTYKMLIGGAFVRSESERTLPTDGANTPRATRKDVRDAVKAARAAWPGWSARTAYNRGQILYRLAEMLEARSGEFEGLGNEDPGQAVDLLVHYAGWTDKYAQLLGSVNPVAAPYFDFSVPEPVGVVGAAAESGLTGVVRALAPAITGGNACIVLAADESAVVACEFGEIVATSDVPAGVVNILTGRQSETFPHLCKHMDVDAVCAPEAMVLPGSQNLGDATENLKRVHSWDTLHRTGGQGLHWVGAFQETKSVWHPVGT
ncbi:MAG: aldehyde dehydrogenase family protein [Armatimonadetes bacterium]|nr:aldehyde dehydrogenase family protein [Armatimonadota bacterium]